MSGLKRALRRFLYLLANDAEHDRVCTEITAFLEGENWQVSGITPSSIDGGDGNQEFLIGAVKR